MAQIMVGAIFRRVVFNEGIERSFNHGRVRRVLRSQADPLSLEEVQVISPNLEIILVHTHRNLSVVGGPMPALQQAVEQHSVMQLTVDT